jgi:tRNA modification GTPase
VTEESRRLYGAIAGGEDTIVALGTPPGRGAIAIIRMSGNDARRIASQHIDPWPLAIREMHLCSITHHSTLLDHALVTVYQAPDSFTGEDVVEVFTHGGHVVPASVLSALIESGARQATPGEFTRRAVLNRKLDVVQAEAIGDLIDARSGAMQQTALYQLDGGLSSRISGLRHGIIDLESLIAYDVDFPEEDDGPISRERVLNAAENLLDSLDLLLATIPVGQIVREGAVVVIAGEPNVGKSSLFNALLGEQRAIVTEISGTTRDAIEAIIDAGTWPIRLIDTAGLRDSSDVVEKLGIEISERHISLAHIVLACGDTRESLERAVSAVSSLSSSPVIQVLTKSDRGEIGSGSTVVAVSAATGAGLNRLRSEIDTTISEVYGQIQPETPVLTRTRHIQSISHAREEIKAFVSAWEGNSLPATVAAVHLRSAALSLEEIIGAVSTEDVLDRVFSSFCVGK